MGVDVLRFQESKRVTEEERKRKGREERERERAGKKGKPENEMGNYEKLRKIKGKRIYGLSVGELEIDFGYL